MNGIEFNSIDRFRQFKKEIRGSKEHLIVGLDIAKRRHHGFFGDANGRTLLKHSMKGTPVQLCVYNA